MPTPRNADTLKLQAYKEQRRYDYELFRQRMQHEDNLIGVRISWLVSSQAFLLTPYVLLYLKVVDIATARQISDKFNVSDFLLSISLIEYIIVLIGLVSCALTIRSTAAAFRSKVDMTFDFLQRHKPDGSFEPGIGLLRKEGVHGASAARGFPVTFAIVWLVLSGTSLEIVSMYQSSEPAYWPYVVLGSSLSMVFYVVRISVVEAVTTRWKTQETINLTRQTSPNFKGAAWAYAITIWGPRAEVLRFSRYKPQPDVAVSRDVAVLAGKSAHTPK